MKRYQSRSAVLLVIMPLLALAAAAQAPTPGIAGSWLGILDLGGTKLRFVLNVERTADGYAAKFDSPDQGATGLPIEKIALNGRSVTFSAPPYSLTYEGTLSESGTDISGTMRQGQAAYPFAFKRTGDVVAIVRPQLPKKPYPYDEAELVYTNSADNVKLTGTLTIPRNGAAKHPAVLLITGSGSQDRDESIAGHKPFLVLADHLTRAGIAVLRVDDRGSGGSDAGDPKATSENFVGDVLAGVDTLKKRSDIDPKKIGLIGHSEGGMIAPIAATRSRDIAFIVMLAGPGQTGADVVVTQNGLLEKASGTPDETIADAAEMTKAINASVLGESDPARIESRIIEAFEKKKAGLTGDRLERFGRVERNLRGRMFLFKTPWYKYFVSFDPTPVLKKVSVPVLAINGELDLQVAAKENLGLIEAALKAGKNKDFTVRAFPRLNHLFQTATTGAPSEYGTITETMSPEVLTTISDWIVKRMLPNAKAKASTQK